MIDWLTEFYTDEDLQAQLTEAVRPLFLAYAASVVDNPSESFVSALIARFVERYLDSSRAQLQEVIEGTIAEGGDPLVALEERFTEWAEKRPGKVRKNEIVRSANALRMQDMADRGITKKVWVASGSEDCPYCKALDGRVVGVEEKFFESSSTFLPEGVTEPLRFNNDHKHPPIHNGCDCSIAEFTE